MRAYAPTDHASKLVRAVKHFAGKALFRSGLHRVLLPNYAVVVLFHRIDDGVGDNDISVTRQRFVEFCDFFHRYCKVITLQQLVEKLDRKEDLRGHVVITFDDGYRDNYEIAAMELKKRGLPACFFIATGFIQTNRVTWWDAEDGIKSEWMSWDDVRVLKRLGFELGAHTVNHIDLGVVAGQEAQWEIEESKRKLEEEVGEKVDLFSYPYGRRDQCSEENRQRVRDLGFKTCPSAYGGVVKPGDDPFYVRRTAVGPWSLSPYHFIVDTIFASLRA